MNASELKYQYEKNNPNGHFFDRKTMKFFGDTMKNYGVRSAIIDTYTEKDVDCWELYRILPVRNNLQTSAYFTTIEFRQIWPKIEYKEV